jgi:methylmalonyl-CoA mutase, N-terminal domain
MEEKAYEYFAKIDELGGMVEAIKTGYPMREIADAAFQYQTEVETGVRKVVGVNAYTEGDDHEMPILRIDPAFETDQVVRVRELRERRDQKLATAALERLQQAARDPEENLIPYLLEATRAHATEGEIVETLQVVFGTYRESPAF